MKKLLPTLLFALFFTAATPGAVASEISTSIVSIEGKNYYVHSVAPGETLYSLSKLYSVSEDELRSANPQVAEGLQAGQVLKIPAGETKTLNPRQQAKAFEQHTVNQGETAYSICKRYGIIIDQLVEDNEGINPLVLSIGQVLNIRKKAMGGSDEQAVDQSVKQYSESMNKVDGDFQYHNVEKGETLYSLQRHYNLTESQIAQYNDVSTGLKAGQILKLPVRVTVIDAPLPAPADSGESKADGSAFPNVSPATAISETDSTLTADSAALTRDQVRPPRSISNINVAMILPLKGEKEVSPNFMDFYKGALTGFEKLKSQGISANVEVYNDTRIPGGINSIVSSPEFAKSDLIIGPVYESELGPVLEFARREGVPVVSPLGAVEAHRSNLIYQIAPGAETKYDKLRNVLYGDKNVIAVYAINKDAEFERDVKGLLPEDYKRLDFYRKMPPASIENLLESGRENVFVLFMAEQGEIEEMMAKISSIQSNLVARSAKNLSITVIGTSRWQRFNNFDRNLFFKLRLCFVTSYYADRSDPRVAAFDHKYISSFGSLPTLYSYRGYDVTRLFVEGYLSSLGADDFSSDAGLNKLGDDLLQMPYSFVQKGANSNHVNQEWGLVQYHDDYTITVQ